MIKLTKYIYTPVNWMRVNLFNSFFNSTLTIISIFLLVKIIPMLVKWGILDATLSGDTPIACKANQGACWTFVKTFWSLFIFGYYPRDQIWRQEYMVILLIIIFATFFIKKLPKLIPLIALVIIYPIVAYIFIFGGYFGLSAVPWQKLGGASLGLILAFCSIFFSFFIAITSALGRRSHRPIVRIICVTYIEFIRGVPYITLLFTAAYMLPLFLPAGSNVNLLVRAVFVTTLFMGAYSAETIRGGLQAIPKGQYEAADALGLSYWKKTALIILPQALKIVVPAYINNIISMIKDQTLIEIIGLHELFGMMYMVINSNLEWMPYFKEGFVFVAFFYWVICFTLSRLSRRLELKNVSRL